MKNDNTDVRCKGVQLFHLAQDKVRRRDPVYTEMNLPFPKMARNLYNWATMSF